MTPLRFNFDATRSCVWVDARSNLHPIHTQTRGLEGWVEVTLNEDGTLNSTIPVKGELALSVDRLTSGNQLYDRELKRRMDARRFPTIAGRITSFQPTEISGRFLVGGDLSFHGHTRSFEHDMTIDVLERTSIEMKGEYVFDIREFGMKPPSMLMLKVYPEVGVRVALFGEVAP
jgi:polyisoprenoid-binding protein YceI